MLKRTISLLLCIVMLIAVLASCDADDSHNHETTEATTSQPQETKPNEETEKDSEQHDHTPSFAVTENLVDSTCMTTGSYDEVVYCSACGYEISRTEKTIIKKEHTSVTDARVEPTYTATGLTEGSHCSVCGTVLVAQEEIPMLLHHYTSTVTDPTCTEKGYTTYTCTDDGCTESYVDNYVNALGHTNSKPVIENQIDPTCKDAGSCDEVVYCFECGEELTRVNKPIDKESHIYTPAITAPTCTAKGYTTYTCHCGDTYVADEVAARGHSMDEWVVTTEPTEDASGEKRRDCKNCEHFETDVVAKLTHDHSRWEQTTLSAVDPTCTATGLTEGKKCSKCGETVVAQDIIPANGHDYGSVVTAPTCTEKGYTTYTCHCGDTYVADEVAARGHSMDEWVVTTEPTEDASGEKRRDCKNCEHFETDVVAKLTHDHSRWEQTTLSAVAPTCTATGLTEGKKCSKCGEVLVEQNELAMIAHNWSEATCHTPSTCSACLQTQGTTLEHVYENKKCSLCGDLKPSTGLKFELVDDYYSVCGIGTCEDTEVVIPSSYNGKPVKAISNKAFYECTSFASIVVPDSVTYIGKQAFQACKFTNIILTDSITHIGDEAFSDSSISSIVLPKGITEIGEALFNCCMKLTSVTIPYGVTSIGNYAFQYCSLLKSLTLPDSITSIGEYAFASGRIQNLVIPNSVVRIESYAFMDYRCQTLTIPLSVTYLGRSVFYEFVRSDLTDIYFEVTAPLATWDPQWNNGCDATMHFYRCVEHTWGEATCIAAATCLRCGVQKDNVYAEHKWQGASCISHPICSVCGIKGTEYEEHDWIAASCTNPKTCAFCHKTEGESLGGHIWDKVSCEEVRTCLRCEAVTIGHTWKDATCVDLKTCIYCAVTEGGRLPHNLDSGICTMCNKSFYYYMELNGNPHQIETVDRYVRFGMRVDKIGLPSQLEIYAGNNPNVPVATLNFNNYGGSDVYDYKTPYVELAPGTYELRYTYYTSYTTRVINGRLQCVGQGLVTSVRFVTIFVY